MLNLSPPKGEDRSDRCNKAVMMHDVFSGVHVLIACYMSCQPYPAYNEQVLAFSLILLTLVQITWMSENVKARVHKNNLRSAVCIHIQLTLELVCALMTPGLSKDIRYHV